MALLPLRVIDQRQIRAQSWPQLGCFDQYRLQVLVPLLGDGHALDRLRRATFGTAQTAITDSLLILGLLAIKYGKAILKMADSPLFRGVMVGFIVCGAGSAFSIYGWLKNVRTRKTA